MGEQINGTSYESVDLNEALDNREISFLVSDVADILDEMNPKARLSFYNKFAEKYNDKLVIRPMKDIKKFFNDSDLDDIVGFNPDDPYFYIDEYDEPQSNTEPWYMMDYFAFVNAIIDNNDDLGNEQVRRSINYYLEMNEFEALYSSVENK